MKVLNFEKIWANENSLASPQDAHLDKLGRIQSTGMKTFFKCRDYYYFHFIENGSGKFFLNDVVFQGAPGHLIFFFPEVKVAYFQTSNVPWQFVWGRFCGKSVGAVLKQLGITRGNPTLEVREPAAMQVRLHDLLHRLCNKGQDPFAPYSSFWELMELIRKHVSAAPSDPVPVPMLDRALRIIDSPLLPLPNVNQLANQLGIGRVTLFRLFRDNLKTAPTDYIENVRFQRACFMLTESNLMLNEIAGFCGLGSGQYFSNWFSRKGGCSPRAYRENAKLRKKSPSKKAPKV